MNQAQAYQRKVLRNWARLEGKPRFVGDLAWAKKQRQAGNVVDVPKKGKA